MGDEVDKMSRCSQTEKKRSYKNLAVDEEESEEPDSNFEECSTKRLHKVHSYAYPAPGMITYFFNRLQELNCLLNKKRQHSGNVECVPEPYGAGSSDFVPAYPVCMPQDRWERRGEEEDIHDKLLHSFCTAEGDIDQPCPSSMLEYWVYLDNQHNIADCSLTRTITPSTPPATQGPSFIHSPSAVTSLTVGSVVAPMVSCPMTDTYSPISSMCSPPGSAWDTLRSVSRSPSCSEQDLVSAAAHLHLLGESLSLIGQHLQETKKMVSMSSSFSLLLDSLLCALAPLICLTEEIPELRSCAQHTQTSTLENIAYVMPGI